MWSNLTTAEAEDLAPMKDFLIGHEQLDLWSEPSSHTLTTTQVSHHCSFMSGQQYFSVGRNVFVQRNGSVCFGWMHPETSVKCFRPVVGGRGFKTVENNIVRPNSGIVPLLGRYGIVLKTTLRERQTSMDSLPTLWASGCGHWALSQYMLQARRTLTHSCVSQTMCRMLWGKILFHRHTPDSPHTPADINIAQNRWEHTHVSSVLLLWRHGPTYHLIYPDRTAARLRSILTSTASALTKYSILYISPEVGLQYEIMHVCIWGRKPHSTPGVVLYGWAAFKNCFPCTHFPADVLNGSGIRWLNPKLGGVPLLLTPLCYPSTLHGKHRRVPPHGSSPRLGDMVC